MISMLRIRVASLLVFAIWAILQVGGFHTHHQGLRSRRHPHPPRKFSKPTRLLIQQESSQSASQVERPQPVRRPRTPQQHKRQAREKKQRRDQLHRVLQSIIYYGTHPGDDDDMAHDAASEPVLRAAKALLSAKTQADFGHFGRRLEAAVEVGIDSESRPIRERLLKATALCGRLQISIKILNNMLDETIIHNSSNSGNSSSNKDDSSDLPLLLPSHMSYLALCSALRHAGKNEALEELVIKLAKAARALGGGKETMVNVVALNTLLASLCGPVRRPDDPNLEKAFSWLQTPEVARDTFFVDLDTTSYNTVLQAAARVGNTAISDSLWSELTREDAAVKPDIRSYNFRLQSLRAFDQQLELFDELIQNQKVFPDRFTIDSVILPLIRAGRVGDVESLLDTFILQSSEQVAQDAFSAFLVTLAKRGELTSARALFDTYVMPCLQVPLDGQNDDNNNNNNNNTSSCTIQPDERHFNVLIDGYRKIVDNQKLLEGKAPEEEDVDIRSWQKKPKGEKRKIWQKKDTEELNNGSVAMDQDTAQYEGRKLYRIMRKSGIRPDAYTLTSMMGLCKSTDELLKLMKDGGISMTPAIVRAAITNCGRLGDPSSSCVLFDVYASGSRDLRFWNVLLGALSEGAKTNNLILDINFSMAAGDVAFNRSKAVVSNLVDGMRCTDAVREILNAMKGSADTVSAPVPNPNSQTYCLVASAFQYESNGAEDAMGLFLGAIDEGIPADGRFVNAVFRCFGDDIDGALDCWKSSIRKECLKYESRTRRRAVSAFRSENKNLIAAYNGMMYVCGRALRPDIALRLAFAMDREGIEPNEVCLNNYSAGKRLKKTQMISEGRSLSVPKLLPKISLVDQYENLLYVECTKYDRFSKRMAKDRRVRIIV
jgi:pentatricopeptide repeat protein